MRKYDWNLVRMTVLGNIEKGILYTTFLAGSKTCNAIAEWGVKMGMHVRFEEPTGVSHGNPIYNYDVKISNSRDEWCRAVTLHYWRIAETVEKIKNDCIS